MRDVLGGVLAGRSLHRGGSRLLPLCHHPLSHRLRRHHLLLPTHRLPPTHHPLLMLLLLLLLPRGELGGAEMPERGFLLRALDLGEELWRDVLHVLSRSPTPTSSSCCCCCCCGSCSGDWHPPDTRLLHSEGRGGVPDRRVGPSGDEVGG